MKQKSFLSSWVVIFGMGLMMACSNYDNSVILPAEGTEITNKEDVSDDPYKAILGEWIIEEGAPSYINHINPWSYTFYADGTYDYSRSDLSYSGTYVIREETEKYYHDTTGPMMWLYKQIEGVYYKYFLRLNPYISPTTGNETGEDYAILFEGDKMHVCGVHKFWKVRPQYTYRKQAK